MTAIAYRDGVLAADTAELCGRLIVGYGDKIAKGPVSIGGAAGDAAACVKFLDAIREGRAADFDASRYDDNFTGLEICNDGVYRYEKHGRSREVAPFHAIGAAMEFLMGAMAAGASAEGAVELAMGYGLAVGKVTLLSADPILGDR